jgi:hypothetical protein
MQILFEYVHAKDVVKIEMLAQEIGRVYIEDGDEYYPPKYHDVRVVVTDYENIHSFIEAVLDII